MIYYFINCKITESEVLLIIGSKDISVIGSSTLLSIMYLLVSLVSHVECLNDPHWDHFCFLMYANDISRVLPRENVKLFADDINLFISGVDVITLNQKCNYCIDTLNQRFIANRLHVIVDKTYTVCSKKVTPK